MIIEERLTTYLHSLDTGNREYLEELRSYAEETGVPVIRREMESFLSVLLAMQKPTHILEVGAGIAYSSLYMAEHSAARIITIENYTKRIPAARENILRAGMEERIILLEAEASGLLHRMQMGECFSLADGQKAEIPPEGFDMIFLDAAKAQYVEILPDVLRLLKTGGLLLADNVLQEGELIESRFVTERRQRTIHERMRQFLWDVKHMPELESCILTVGDGVSLSIKK